MSAIFTSFEFFFNNNEFADVILCGQGQINTETVDTIKTQVLEQMRILKGKNKMKRNQT